MAENCPFDIAEDELLARFVLYSKHIREDKTIRPEAFMPHPHTELSVTRHHGLRTNQVWHQGASVASKCQKTLYGRSDIIALHVRTTGLGISAAPLPDNPNHANIVNWPSAKCDQKQLAMSLAELASKLIEVQPEDNSLSGEVGSNEGTL